VNDISSLHGPVAGDAVELRIGVDMVKRGLVAAPVLVAIGLLIWGAPGAWSTAYAIGLVFVNFLLSAALITWAANISLGALMAATLFGYLLRLGLIFVAVYLVRDAGWISLPAVGAAIIVTHLGLLAWELRHVSISLAYPGLKPGTKPAHPLAPKSVVPKP
jgi:hypothetical protein